jgi:hypothetical protein
MRDRGGFKGDFDDLVHNIKTFLDKAAYQLCDGFAQNRLEIRTQFAGAANNFLKIPRVITSPFILEEA